MDVSVVVQDPVVAVRTRLQLRGRDPGSRLSDDVFRRAIERDGRFNEVTERSMALHEFGRRRVFGTARDAARGRA